MQSTGRTIYNMVPRNRRHHQYYSGSIMIFGLFGFQGSASGAAAIDTTVTGQIIAMILAVWFQP